MAQRRHKQKKHRGSNAFASVRFVGIDAKGARLTPTMMRDLLAYSEVVKAVARDIWHEENSGRLPKNFEDSFQISVGDISRGSTNCNVVRETRIGGRIAGELVGMDDVFSRAQTRIHDALRLGESGGEYDAIVERHIPRLAATHDEWHEDSYMEIAARGEPVPARLTKGVRHRLRTVKPRERVDSVSLIGVIVQVDTDDKEAFSVRTMMDRRITGTFHKKLRDLVFAAQQSKQVVRFRGLLRMVNDAPTFHAAEGELVTVPFAQMDVKYVKSRIAELRKLGAGWLDGEGSAIGRGVIEAVLAVVSAVTEEHGILPPLMFPKEDGGVGLEWAFDHSTCIVTFSVEDSVVYADAFHRVTHKGPHFEGPHLSTQSIVSVVVSASKGEQV